MKTVTLIKEGQRHLIEVRGDKFEIRRHGETRPLLQCWSRQLADVYFRDVESNHVRQSRYESWRHLQSSGEAAAMGGAS
jgi:hypothetical protein